MRLDPFEYVHYTMGSTLAGFSLCSGVLTPMVEISEDCKWMMRYYCWVQLAWFQRPIMFIT